MRDFVVHEGPDSVLSHLEVDKAGELAQSAEKKLISPISRKLNVAIDLFPGRIITGLAFRGTMIRSHEEKSTDWQRDSRICTSVRLSSVPNVQTSVKNGRTTSKDLTLQRRLRVGKDCSTWHWALIGSH